MGVGSCQLHRKARAREAFIASFPNLRLEKNKLKNQIRLHFCFVFIVVIK